MDVDSGDAASVGPSSRRAGRARRRVIGWTLGLLFLAVLLLAVVMAWQAFTAYHRLEAAAARIPELREQVVSGDEEGAQRAAREFREDTRTARDALDGPQWGLLEVAPVVGDDVEAVRTVTEVVDDLGDGALPALLQAGEFIDPASLAPRNGRIRLAPIEKAAPHVRAAHEAVTQAHERMSEVATRGLTERLRGPVSDLSARLEEASSLTRTAAQAAELLPSMLGAEKPRTYLLLTQNNAEPRALGGLPGAAIVIRANNGRIKLVEHYAASDFGNFGEPVMRLSKAERALYGTQIGRYLLNATATPDFPRAAELSRRMFRVATGRQVDGVATVDPYALQLMLGASGPVELPTGHRLTGDNAARILLNRTYIDMPDPAAQDAFFAAAAAAVFDKVTSGGVDMRATVKALAEGIRQRRVMLWSAQEQEQQVIAGTALSGAMTGRSPDGAPVVGVYVHDRSGAKIAFYESLGVELRPLGCQAEVRRVRVTATVRSNVPKNVDRLPDYLTGGGRTVPEGHIRTDLLVYAPAGGIITQVRSGGERVPVTAHVHDGLHVAERHLRLKPGETTTASYDIRLDGNSDRPAELRVTPLATERRVSVKTSHCN